MSGSMGGGTMDNISDNKLGEASEKAGLPDYACQLSGDKQTVSFTCPFCLVEHFHLVDVEKFGIHEVVHFDNDQCAYHPNGYNLFYT